MKILKPSIVFTILAAALSALGPAAAQKISGFLAAKKADAAAVNMILLWDGGAAPTGWTIVTAYDGRYPRGESAANFGVTGGSANHAPTVASVALSNPSTGFAVSGSTAVSSYTHTHSALSATIGAALNFPATQSLKLIRFDGIPTTIPAGAIALFDSAVPAGWTRQASFDNRFIQASSTVQASGSDSHTHSVTWSSLGAASGNSNGNTSNLGSTNTHTHTAPAAAVTSAMTALPPYVQVVIGKANSNTAVPAGLIALYDGDPGAGWTVLSNSGGPFYQQFIRGSSAYNGTSQGSATHSHAALTSGNSGAAAVNRGSATAGTAIAGPSHTHTLTATFNGGTGNLPLYFNVVVAKKAGNSAPSAPTQNSPAAGAIGLSTSPTFTMTATDPDSDKLGYKVTVYSNSSCTTPVQTNDQAVSSAGWSGTNAVCTAAPNACYQSGTQATFITQTPLNAATQYWWKASAKDPDGSGTFTDSAACNSLTTVANIISVVISTDGTVAYGTLTAGASATTLPAGRNDGQTAQNNGNVVEIFNIKGQNTACPWTLSGAAGTEQYKHEFSKNDGSSWTALTTSYQQLASLVLPGASQDFDLRITVPSSTSCFNQQNADITIQAVVL